MGDASHINRANSCVLSGHNTSLVIITRASPCFMQRKFRSLTIDHQEVTLNNFLLTLSVARSHSLSGTEGGVWWNTQNCPSKGCNPVPFKKPMRDYPLLGAGISTPEISYTEVKPSVPQKVTTFTDIVSLKRCLRWFPMVQWQHSELSTAWGMGSIPGRGTKILHA